MRWPFEPRHDTLWAASPGDVARDGRTLALGARMWDASGDYVFAQRQARAKQPAFAGLEHLDDTRAVLRLGGSKQPFVLRILQNTSNAAPNATDWIESDLTVEGFARGPALVLRFDNLEELLPDRAARHAFVRGPLLGRFRRQSAALRNAPARPRIWHSRERAPEGLGLHGAFEDDAMRDRVRDALLARFLADLRWPLAAPATAGRTRPFFRADDLPTRSGLAVHDAVDCGARVTAKGELYGWPAGTPTIAPHPNAQDAASLRPGSRAWRVDVRDPKRRGNLSLWIAAYHLNDDGRLRGPDGSRDLSAWTSADPVLRTLGWPKGNHVHLEVLGAHENRARADLWLATDFVVALEAASARARVATDGLPTPRALPRDRSRAQKSSAIGRFVASLPRLDGVCVRRQAGADRFELRGPPLRLGESFRWDGRAFVRALSRDAEIRIGPGTEAKPPRLRPGPLDVSWSRPPTQLVPDAPAARKQLLQSLLRRIATVGIASKTERGSNLHK